MQRSHLAEPSHCCLGCPQQGRESQMVFGSSQTSAALLFQLPAVGAEVWDAREEERANSGASQQESFRVIHGDLILVIASPPGSGQLGVRATASFARGCHFQFPSASLSAKLRPIPAISFSLDGCRDAIFIGLTGNCWHITGLRNVIVF